MTRNNRMASLYNINTRLAPLYNFMTETMMTQDYSNPLVYWSVMGEMMSHFEVFFNINIQCSTSAAQKIEKLSETPATVPIRDGHADPNADAHRCASDAS